MLICKLMLSAKVHKVFTCLLQWWRDRFRCGMDLLNLSMGFNIVAPYMKFLHLNWCIAECISKQPHFLISPQMFPICGYNNSIVNWYKSSSILKTLAKCHTDYISIFKKEWHLDFHTLISHTIWNNQIYRHNSEALGFAITFQ